jgi:hypothetical protein
MRHNIQIERPGQNGITWTVVAGHARDKAGRIFWPIHANKHKVICMYYGHTEVSTLIKNVAGMARSYNNVYLSKYHSVLKYDCSYSASLARFLKISNNSHA